MKKRRMIASIICIVLVATMLVTSVVAMCM